MKPKVLVTFRMVGGSVLDTSVRMNPREKLYTRFNKLYKKPFRTHLVLINEDTGKFIPLNTLAKDCNKVVMAREVCLCDGSCLTRGAQ